MGIYEQHDSYDGNFLDQGAAHDLDAHIECLVRDVDNRIARQRMRWPNPNPDDELEQVWRCYEAAWAHAVFHAGEPTESGASAANELAYWWQRFQQAVIDEGNK